MDGVHSAGTYPRDQEIPRGRVASKDDYVMLSVGLDLKWSMIG